MHIVNLGIAVLVVAFLDYALGQVGFRPTGDMLWVMRFGFVGAFFFIITAIRQGMGK